MSNFILLVLAFIATNLVLSDAQTVANQCLAEQRRNNVDNNNNNDNNGPDPTPEELTMAAFDAICSYQDYINCFATRLPNSRLVPDQFLNLIFNKDNLRVAYQGLCTLDLETLRPNIRCLLSTPEVRRCYNAFNFGVNQVVTLQNQQQLPQVTLEELVCNVSVARYRCETPVYGFCNEEVGEIMQNFFYAGVPQQCRENTGVSSRYTAIFNSAPSTPANVLLNTMLVAVSVFLLKSL